MDLVKLGKIIRKRRVMLALRQEDLSELSGINSRTIHQIETGDANPSIKTLIRIADVLGFEISLEIKKLN
jgi:transcriptional regulator with XRE-family HTH domain